MSLPLVLFAGGERLVGVPERGVFPVEALKDLSNVLPTFMSSVRYSRRSSRKPVKAP